MRYAFSVTSLTIVQLVLTWAVSARAETAGATAADAPVSTELEEVDERAAGENLLREMTGPGIRLSADRRFQLPEPKFVSIAGESVATATAEKALQEIAGRYGVSGFSRDSIVAPISVRTDSINNEAGERIGHFIDVVFMVHQSIAQIRTSPVLDDFQSDPEADQSAIGFADLDTSDELEVNKTRPLTKAELKEHGIELEGKFETLGWLQLPLLSKVVVRGVARARRSVWSSSDEDAPVILTWLLDSRFHSDSPQAESLSNQWRAIERTSTGEKKLGPPQPYAGLGGYVAITPLPDEPTASLVQICFVIHEPQAWFHGRNLLRSKLPILIQDRVRNLRRELQAKS